MKIKILIFFIILSFIAPALHFIEHNHSYNPFDKKLEHSVTTDIPAERISYNKDSEISKKDKVNFKIDICSVSLFNSFFRNNYYTPVVKPEFRIKYIYSLNILHKTIKSNKIIFIAPKNSPPLV